MPEKYKYPPNDPFLERRHSKVFRKRHGEFFEVVISFHNSLQNQDFFSFNKMFIFAGYFSHTAYAYHKLHPKTHSAIPPEYGDTTCVRLLHSLATYRSPTCREHHQAFWSTQANSDISLLHVKIIIYLLKKLHRNPKHYICFFFKDPREYNGGCCNFLSCTVFSQQFFERVFLKKKQFCA